MVKKRDNETNEDSDVLKEIRDRLDILISVSVPLYEKSKYTKYFRKDAETILDVLRLCDGNHTTEDICKQLNKSGTKIGNDLSKLLRMNLIQSFRLGKETVYVRLK